MAILTVLMDKELISQETVYRILSGHKIDSILLKIKITCIPVSNLNTNKKVTQMKNFMNQKRKSPNKSLRNLKKDLKQHQNLVSTK